MFEAAAHDADLTPSGRRRDRSWTREFRATLSLAWPMILSNLAGTALTTIDLVLIGRLGAEVLGAAALATNLFHAALITSIGVVSAVSPLVSAEYGRCRHAVREIRRSVRQGLWVAFTAFVPVSLVLSQGETLLRFFGQDPSLSAAAGAYLHALQWALLPNLAFVVLRTFMAALGRPGWGLAIALLGLPVNFALASLLIFGGVGLPALGLVGAGLATTITATLGFLAIALVIVRDRRFRRYSVFGRVWRPDWPRFRRIWRIGLPIAATLLFEVLLFSSAGLAMGTIGVTELAAHTVALQISALCFMVPLGLGQTATIRVGHAFGAGDPREVAMAGWSAFALAMAFALATAALLIGAPRLLVGAFLDLGDPATAAVLGFAVSFLAMAALFQLADAAQVVGAGMLRGLQDTRVPMMLAGIGYWAVGAPLGLGLGFAVGLGGLGIWIGLATGLAAVAALMLWRWANRERLGLVQPMRPA